MNDELADYPGDERRSSGDLVLYRLGRVEVLAESTAKSLDRLETQVTRLLGAVSVLAVIATALAMAVATSLIK